MTAPASPFAQAFRQHVIPRIRELATIAGQCLALVDDLSFADARAPVIREAIRLGAGRLDGAMYGQFADWLDAEILDAWDKAEKEQAALAEQMAKAQEARWAAMTPAHRRVIEDLDRCEDEFIAWWEAQQHQQPAEEPEYVG